MFVLLNAPLQLRRHHHHWQQDLGEKSTVFQEVGWFCWRIFLKNANLLCLPLKIIYTQLWIFSVYLFEIHSSCFLLVVLDLANKVFDFSFFLHDFVYTTPSILSVSHSFRRNLSLSHKTLGTIIRQEKLQGKWMVRRVRKDEFSFIIAFTSSKMTSHISGVM